MVSPEDELELPGDVVSVSLVGLLVVGESVLPALAVVTPAVVSDALVSAMVLVEPSESVSAPPPSNEHPSPNTERNSNSRFTKPGASSPGHGLMTTRRTGPRAGYHGMPSQGTGTRGAEGCG